MPLDVVVDVAVAEMLVVVVVVLDFASLVLVFLAFALPLLAEGLEPPGLWPERLGLDAWLRVEGCCAMPDPLEAGGCWEEVVELEVVVEEDDDEEDEDEEDVEDGEDGDEDDVEDGDEDDMEDGDEDELVGVALEVVEVADGEVQDSVSFAIRALAGSRPGGTGIADTGVPGATLAVKLNACPPSTVAVTTHSSAEAAGTAPRALAASTTPTVATATLTTLSFVLFIIVA